MSYHNRDTGADCRRELVVLAPNHVLGKLVDGWLGLRVLGAGAGLELANLRKSAVRRTG